MVSRIIGRVGRRSIATLHYTTGLFALTFHLFQLLFVRQKEGRSLVWRGIVEQIYFTAVQALPVIIPTALLIGTTMVIQFARLTNQYDMGRLAVILVIREMGPFLSALIVILRSATAVTIELGYMNVLREIETLEMAGIDPLRLIGLPRLVGITSAIMCLFIVFDLVAIVGGYALVWAFTDIQVGSFFASIGQALTAVDILVSLIKAFSFGVGITVICMYRGLTCTGQMTRIAVNTSSAAVECFFFCLMMDFLISAVFYV